MVGQLIRKNELISFFQLSFIISWGIWIFSPVISSGDAGINAIAVMTGSFGPAVSAIIITFVKMDEKNIYTVFKPKILLISFTFIFLIAILSARVFFRTTYQPLSLFHMAVLSLAASATISFIYSFYSLLKGLIDSALPLKSRVKWYSLGIFLFPAASIAGIIADMLIGGKAPSLLGDRSWYQYGYLVFIIFSATLLFGGPLNEELGWRGFAMPRLLKKFNSIKATLVLGFLWTLWHAPLYFNGFYAGGAGALVSRFIWNIPLTFFFTWVFLHTRGDLPATVFLHTSFNVTMGTTLVIPMSAGSSMAANVIIILSLILIILIDPVWRKNYKDISISSKASAGFFKA